MSADRRGATRRNGAPRLSVRALVLLVVLLPTIALVVAVAGPVVSAWQERNEARQVAAEVEHLVEVIDARAALADERVATSVLLVASDYGLEGDDLEQMFSVDYEQALAEARAVVDADPTIASTPALADDLERLQALRAQVDAGTVGFGAADAVLTDHSDDLDDLWAGHVARLSAYLDDGFASLGPSDALLLEHSLLLYAAGNERTEVARALLAGEGQRGDEGRLVAADARFDAAAEQVRPDLGPQAEAAWAEWQEDADARRFRETIDAAVAQAAAGEVEDHAGDPFGFGAAFDGAARWTELLTEVERALGTDLLADAQAAADGAGERSVLQAGLTALLAVVALVAAGLLARSFVQPVRRLGASARDVRDGELAFDRLEPSGPKELADAAVAFNEMAETLAAVQAQAVRLAEDPLAAEPEAPVPGRTGAALHAAIDRLREAIRTSEQQRAALHDLAVHDQLTGLLNRSAAVDALDRAVASAARHGSRPMVLFIDLDGLKQINDRHGHEAGDEALRTVAAALRLTTRDADAVARYGGDEFLVAGLVDGRGEVEVMAERIRAAVSSSTVPWADGVLTVSCSIGVALGDGASDAGTLVRRADGALYQAKRDGKDRVEWAEVAP